MERYVGAEWLDELPAEDPGALGSRRDLRLLNFCMGNTAIVARTLSSACADKPPRRVVELGAGDGDFMLQVVRRLRGIWNCGKAVLVDRQNAASCETRKAFAALGWEVEMVHADVFDWLARPATSGEVFLANLFVHHFADSQLTALLRAVAQRAEIFIALEPRRSLWSFGFSRLVGMLGCNRVTRHDAPVSVQAGFRGNELSQLWPRAVDWSLEERRAGPFSHLFLARRI